MATEVASAKAVEDARGAKEREKQSAMDSFFALYSPRARRGSEKLRVFVLLANGWKLTIRRGRTVLIRASLWSFMVEISSWISTFAPALPSVLALAGSSLGLDLQPQPGGLRAAFIFGATRATVRRAVQEPARAGAIARFGARVGTWLQGLCGVLLV